MRTGRRWHSQNASSPTTAEMACFSIDVNAFPLVTNASTLVAENTIASPMMSNKAALETSK